MAVYTIKSTKAGVYQYTNIHIDKNTGEISPKSIYQKSTVKFTPPACRFSWHLGY